MKHKFIIVLLALCISGSMSARELLSTDFMETQGEWTINDVNISSLSFVWQQTKQYGMKATGYANNAHHETESWLVSPVVSLKDVVEPKLTFSHARKYGDLSQISVKATADGETWTTLEVSAWPDGSSWNYVDAEVDLAAFDGSDYFQIAFVYTSTAVSGTTWEIKEATISGSDPKIGDLYYTLDPTNHVAYITYGGYGAYANMESLSIPASVNFRDDTYSVIGIKEKAFWGAFSLESVTIPNNIEFIEDYAFAGCRNLTSVQIPSSILLLGDSAFYNCSNLTSVSIEGNSSTQIGEDIFSKCNLTEVYWNVPDIADYDLIPPYSDRITVTLIAEDLFGGDLPWESVYLYAWDTDNAPIRGDWPGSIVEKDEDGNYTYTFSSNYSSSNPVNMIWTNGTDQTVDIKNVKQSSVYLLGWDSGTDILYYSWSHRTPPFNKLCSNQLKLTFGSSVERIPAHLCDGVIQLNELKIGSNISQIGTSAFKECTSLQSVMLPNSVEEIGNSAFKGCSSMTELYLEENITSYGDNAFANCSSLESIYNYRERPVKLGENTFDGVDYFNCTLYVLAGSVDMYKSSGSDWKDFYFVEAISATSTSTTGVTVTPAETTAEVVWPSVPGAATYELVITDKTGNVVCTLVFNANGQLTQIAFNAPSRDHAPQQTQTAGFAFTVTGLAEGKSYNLTITAKSNNGATLDEQFVSFRTNGEGEEEEDIDNVMTSEKSSKLLRDGQIYILRGEKVYTLQGQEVK